uniref:Uncharacterized protein n=1 Tax=Arundo donax TaxID=35708 RepID=A0A0A9AVR3_ARUDO
MLFINDISFRYIKSEKLEECIVQCNCLKFKFV